jgi:hypothetical protein
LDFGDLNDSIIAEARSVHGFQILIFNRIRRKKKCKATQSVLIMFVKNFIAH